ncbi:hypothetical protein L873DRAFT_1817790 [Choiromyces venosus 120613-1]|uniref:Uncharacterized protein n=1 Tax=Choiromyces venosus 120613-1 TaxID=1336337 RepID=A0A3N4J1V9_9PEZI|nr:hypothetical protein L873DRAFT_1817790 [Choiromyces venosus 120613-1]
MSDTSFNLFHPCCGPKYNCLHMCLFCFELHFEFHKVVFCCHLASDKVLFQIFDILTTTLLI